MAEHHYDKDQWPVGTRVRVNGYIDLDGIPNPTEALPGRVGIIVEHGHLYLKVRLVGLDGVWCFTGLELNRE